MKLDIKVIRRELNLQITGTLQVGREKIPLSVYCRLKGDQHQDEVALQKDMEATVTAGKQQLLKQAQEVLRDIIREGQEAQRMLDVLELGDTRMIQPSPGKGICSVCHREFDLHYIAGTADLCMKHINPGYI